MAKEHENVRRNVVSSINRLISGYGGEVSQCGVKTFDIPEFDATSGFWANPGYVTNKPPRWIVQLIHQGGVFQAQAPQHGGASRLGFFNTNSTSRKILAVAVRIIPAIKVPGTEFQVYEDWEWLLYYCFASPLKQGSGAQLIEGFDPATGKIEYLGETLPYIAAGLVGLCAPDSVYPAPDTATQPPPQISYKQATAAISRLIHSDPVARKTSENGEE